MFNRKIPLTMKAITPLHVGCGNELGWVDLPIQREKHTGYPKIEASGLKGCFREAFESLAESEEDVEKIHILFGYDADSTNQFFKDGKMETAEGIKAKFTEKDRDKFAGAIGFLDARILLFPVKSAKNIFAYVTCPDVLNGFRSFLIDIIGIDSDVKIPSLKDTAIFSTEMAINGKVILEDYTLQGSSDGLDQMIKWLKPYLSSEAEGTTTDLNQQLVIVPNDVFRDFVTLHTEVITRTKIDNQTGTVKDGALFSEEYLPKESILYTGVLFSNINFNTKENPNPEYAKSVEKNFKTEMSKHKTIQIGGNATLGKGFVRIHTKWE